MNYWAQMSADFAAQKNYLDELFKVYPLNPNKRREISEELWSEIQNAYNSQNNVELIKLLLKHKLFPIKDSYVAYLRKDPSAIERNPNIINRIAGNLYQMDLNKIYEKCTEPKETNRQIGPLFKRWISLGTIGCPVFTNVDEFLSCNENAILNMSDEAMKKFAIEYLGYQRIDKGLDFIARFNNKYVIAEAKFLTDFGGHQDAQFDDAITTMNSPLTIPNKLNAEVVKIAILDGVLYINSKSKMYKHLKDNPNEIIVSSLVLREFLYSI